MRSTLLVTAMLSALLGSAATYLLTRSASPDVAPVVLTTTETAGAMDKTVAPRLAATTSLPVTAGDVAGSAFVDDGQDVARQEAQRNALAQAFAGEPVDAAWSAATESHLSKTMSSDIMIASEIIPDQLEVDCRSSLCLVKGRFTKYNDASDWGLMLVTAAGSAFGKAMPVVTPGPDGKAYLEMYAQRP